jgi:putative transposase
MRRATGRSPPWCAHATTSRARPAGRPQPAGRPTSGDGATRRKSAITSDKPQHRRRSIRLKGCDYCQAGAYFITTVTQGRACLFGEVVDGEVGLNECGAIVREEWFRSAEIRREIVLLPDEFVVMPNHVHGIVWIVGSPIAPTNVVATTGPVGATGRSPLQGTYSPRGPANRSSASFIAGFKSAAIRRINQHHGTTRQPVWQRNYYEHIIRDEKSFQRIRDYILNNPLRWHLNRENLNRTGEDKVWDPLFQSTGGRNLMPWRSS